MFVLFHFSFPKTSKVLKKYALMNSYAIYYVYFYKEINSMLLLLSRYLKYLSRFMKLIKGRLEAVALKPPQLIDLQTFIVCATVCVRECVCVQLYPFSMNETLLRAIHATGNKRKHNIPRTGRHSSELEMCLIFGR